MTRISVEGTPHAPAANHAPGANHASGAHVEREAGGMAVADRDGRCTGREPEVYALPGGLTLWQVWREDLARHDGDWTLPGFRALAVQRFGVWHRTLRSRVVRKVVGRVWLSLYRYVRNGYGIELPYTTVVGRRLRIEHQGGITVHGFTRIGDDCVIRQGVTIGNKSVSEPLMAPVLGNGVDVGAGAVIVGDVVVGDGARIGANAVVLHDVPAGATAVGIPARVLPSKPS